MLHTRAVSVARKVARYGMRQSAIILAQRMRQYCDQEYWRYAVTHNRAHTTWDEFVQLHQLPENGQSFMRTLTEHLNIPTTSVVPPSLSHEELTALADRLSNRVDLIGSGPVAYTTMPWHTDIRLRADTTMHDVQFDSSSFYKDIAITSGASNTLHKDIKVPWELSRVQHLPVIAYAYQCTGNRAYARTCILQICDWIEKNKFMCGVNWMCPMDVGLRAISWVWVVRLIRDELKSDQESFKQIITSLHDHAVYLEHNWELYDGRTSNHYLSDLVGYYYVCYFFRTVRAYQEKAAWCLEQILQELDKQVFDEGTDYEGSTNYHRLVTELMYHAVLVSGECGVTLSDDVLKKIDRMIDFIASCTSSKGSLIALGDHDSGKVFYWQYIQKLHHDTHIVSCGDIKKYPAFGVTIVSKNKIHASFKEQVYTARQPSGHIHNDALSCTVSYDKYDLFVDPGSFVYTPSVYWRNYFRSSRVHTTFSIKGHESVPFDEQLFRLAMQECNANMIVEQSDTIISLHAHHDLYARFGLRAHRRMLMNDIEKKVILIDWWQKLEDKEYLFDAVHTTLWNFTLAPECTAMPMQAGIIITVDGEQIAHIQSDLDLSLHVGCVSRTYGTKDAATFLQAEQPLIITTPVTTVITFF